MAHRISSREEFFDSDDTKKWSDLAEAQMAEPNLDSIKGIFGPYIERFQPLGPIADMGCGTGWARPAFVGIEYNGFDQNPDMLAGARKNWPSDRFFLSPLSMITQSFPEMKNRFRTALFCTVLQHNHWEVAREILQETYRLLKPGGQCMLYEATYSEKNYPAHTRQKYRLPDIDLNYLGPVDGGAIFTSNGWKAFLRENGFETLLYDGDCTYITKKV